MKKIAKENSKTFSIERKKIVSLMIFPRLLFYLFWHTGLLGRYYCVCVHSNGIVHISNVPRGSITINGGISYKLHTSGAYLSQLGG